LSGGGLFTLAAVQLVLTAAPGIAAVLVALRQGVRREPVLLAIALAASGAAAMLTFWVYFSVPGLGNACAYALFFGSAGLIAWLWPEVSVHRDLLRRLAVPLGLWALGTFFMVFFGFLHGGGSAAVGTASLRFSTNPSQMASDSFIPLFFSDWMFAGKPGPVPLFAPDWMFSDRPPLQVAYVLTQRAFGWDGETLHYEVLGIALQQFWIVGMWALLTAARVSARTRSLAIVGAFAGDMAIVNSFYVWPKLLGAAFVLAALALLAVPRERALREQPLTVVLLGTLAGLALLAHGTSIFGLIPVAAIALWKGLPQWRWVAAGAAAALLLVGPWMAYQQYGNPPGNRLLKWHIGGSAEIDDRGTLETIVDEYREAGVGATLENKLNNFFHMAGGDPGVPPPLPGEMPHGDVATEIGDVLDALANGEFGVATSKVREIRYWHLLWTFGLLMLAAPLIAYGRLRGRWRDAEDWWFARLCLIFFAIGAVAWGLLMFGNTGARTVTLQGSLALPLIGLAGLVAGLRATYPRWAAWLVGANVVTTIVLYWSTLVPQPPALTPDNSVELFELVAAAVCLLGFVMLAFSWRGRIALPGSWKSSTS
jgi:hypothetical protein